MNRRLTLTCAALTAAALVLASCESAGGGTSAANEELTLAAAESIPNLDSTSLAGGKIKMAVLSQLYDTLLTFDKNRNPQPQLAKSWNLSNDHSTLTFHLRSGLKFSDGTPLTAEDVVWNITHAQAKETGATLRPLFMTITHATAVDEQTVRLSFDRPLARPLAIFEYLFIAKQQDTAQQLKSAPIGTGPFKLQSWNSRRTVLVANDYYWNKDEVTLDKITFRSTGDKQAARLLFRTNQADLLVNPNWKHFADYTEDSSVQTLLAGKGGRVEMFLLNAAKPPFDNVYARRAFEASIDREAIVKTVYYGQTEPWCLPWPKGSSGYEASPDLARDCPPNLAKSNRMLAKAGHPEGLNFSILTPPGIHAKVSQVAQQHLAKVGLDATIDMVEPAVFFKRAFSGEWQALTASVQRLSLDSATAMLFGVPLQNGGVSNFKSPEYQRLIDRVLYRHPGGNRQADMHRLNEYLIEQSFIVPVTTQAPHYVFDTDVHGVKTTIDGYLVLEHVSVGG